MSKMININVSPQTANFLQLELKDRIHNTLYDAATLSNVESIGELIAELRTLQKLMVSNNITKGAE